MHPHTAQTPRGAGLQRGRPPVPQFPADAALAPADEILFEEIADVIDIDRVPRKSFRSRAHSTYVERRLRGRQKSRRSIAAAARSSCDCTSSPQSVGGPRAGESGGGSGGSPRCVRIFRIGTGLGVTRSAGCRRHTPGTHAETPPPPGPWAWPRLLREVSCEGQAPVPAKHEPVQTPLASAITARLSLWLGANTPSLFQGGRRCRCLRGGGTRSASLSRNSNGESSTTPLAPGRVDFRVRPGPTQLAALCRGSADAPDAAARVTSHRESLPCERRPGTIPQQMFQALKIAGHVAVDQRDADARVHRKPAVLPGEHVGGRSGVEQVSEPKPADHAAAHPLGERRQVGVRDRRDGRGVPPRRGPARAARRGRATRASSRGSRRHFLWSGVFSGRGQCMGEEFPLECPNYGGDIRLIAFITEAGPIQKILTHLGEPLVPPPLSPARGPPTDCGELGQTHDERGVFQATERRAARDRHPQPLSRAGREVTTKRPGGRTRRDSALTPEKCHSRREDGRSGKRFLGSPRREQPAPRGSRVVQQSGHACGSAIGRPILRAGGPAPPRP